jgi:hypothetical protein
MEKGAGVNASPFLITLRSKPAALPMWNEATHPRPGEQADHCYLRICHQRTRRVCLTRCRPVSGRTSSGQTHSTCNIFPIQLTAFTAGRALPRTPPQFGIGRQATEPGHRDTAPGRVRSNLRDPAGWFPRRQEGADYPGTR